MKPVEILTSYKSLLHEVKFLLNWYNKYFNCIFITSFDNELNEALKKLNRDYYKLMLILNTDIAVNSSIKSLFRIIASEHVNMVTEDKLAFIDQVIVFLNDNEERLLHILNNADQSGNNNYLYYFDEGYKDIKSITNRMEVMIRSSQRLHKPYLRISA